MLLFADSFANYRSNADLALRYSGFNSYWTPNSPTAGRFDGAGMLCAPLNFTWLLTWPFANSRKTLTMGFAFYIPLSSGQSVNANPLCQFWDSGNAQVGLVISGNFTNGLALQAVRGGQGFSQSLTNIGSPSGNVITLNAWHYLQFQATIDPSAGSVVVTLDGANIMNLTGLNTQYTSNATANQASLNGATTTWFDDFYVADLTGSFNNGFLGEIKIAGGLPNANGVSGIWTKNAAAWAANTVMALDQTILDSNGNLQRVSALASGSSTGGAPPSWATVAGQSTTDNQVTWKCLGAETDYLLVNELTPDDDFSYLSDATVGDQATFKFPAISAPAVAGVMLWARLKKDDAGTRAVRLVANSAGTQVNNGADLYMSTTYQMYSMVLESDPHTGAPWTATAVNAADFGVKVTV